MIEKEIESAIIAAINALGIAGLTVRSAWNAAAEGSVKNAESPATICIIDIKCGQRQFSTFGMCPCELPITMSAAIDATTDPQGVMLETVYGALADMIQAWHLDDNDELRTALTTANFTPDGISVGGGEAPTFNADDDAWEFDVSLTVTGHVAHNHNNNEGGL